MSLSRDDVLHKIRADTYTTAEMQALQVQELLVILDEIKDEILRLGWLLAETKLAMSDAKIALRRAKKIEPYHGDAMDNKFELEGIRDAIQARASSLKEAKSTLQTVIRSI